MRLLHKLYALVTGYFWIPCPHCGEMFGGHEWRLYDNRRDTIPASPGGNSLSGTAICPACTRAGVGDRAWGAYPIRLEVSGQ